MIHKEVPNRPYIFPGIFMMGPCQNYVLNVFRFLTGKVAIIPPSAVTTHRWRRNNKLVFENTFMGSTLATALLHCFPIIQWYSKSL